MAKYYGEIGFETTAEIRPGVWKTGIITREYAGDLVRSVYNWQNGSKINDDLSISNQISIIADSFAEENMGFIKYATFSGQKWKVSSVEVQYPRLILNLGSLFNIEEEGVDDVLDGE